MSVHIQLIFSPREHCMRRKVAEYRLIIAVIADLFLFTLNTYCTVARLVLNVYCVSMLDVNN